MSEREAAPKQLSVIEASIGMIAVIAIFYVLGQAAVVAVPFMFALILTLLFYPIVRWGRDRGVPTFMMVLLVIVMIIGVCFPIGVVASSRIQSMINILPEYYEKLIDVGHKILSQYDILRDIVDQPNIISASAAGQFLSGMGVMINWVSRMVLILVFMFFMLLESPLAEARFRKIFKSRDTDRVLSVAKNALAQISKYLRTLAVISFVTGCLVWGALAGIGVEFALAWGVLAFFLNFIPTVGSIVASVPPVLLAIVQFYPNWTPAILAAVSQLLIQFTVGNIITPKVMGDTLNLSPVVILISLTCWGMLWGISGMLLSVPLTVMIRIVCENIDELRFIADMICSAENLSEK